MRICIAADGAYIDSIVSQFFGRCRNFLFIDPETGDLDIVPNRAAGLNNAGTRAAGAAISRGPAAIITGRIGKNALHALRKARIEVFRGKNMTAWEALELYRSGKLEKIG